MKKRETVSTIMSEVRANGSISTKKPSTITMKIGHRLANDAYGLFLDEQEDKKPENGLVGFELVAIYEDGEPEPEAIEIEVEEDVCESCGKVVNEEIGFVYTEDSVYLCIDCAEEMEKFVEPETEPESEKDGE